MSRHQLPAPRTAPNHLNTPPRNASARLGGSRSFRRRPQAGSECGEQGAGQGAGGCREARCARALAFQCR